MDVSNTDTEAALSSVREGALHEATAVQVIRRPKAHVNHTYYDYARVSLSDTLPINEREFMTRKRIDEMTFTQKVFHVLSQSVYYPIIRWRSHGRAFSVEIPKRLEDEVLPIYFGHRRYSSFLRQLSNHGFKVLTRGPDRNCQYHEVRDFSIVTI
jgi:HSF-type DNA-binding